MISRQLSSSDIHDILIHLKNECKTGYLSDLGEPCEPCRNDFYGRKCGDQCHCNKNEIDNNENDAAQSNEAFESVYDTIDESQMIDMPTHYSISITESSSDSSAENFVSDGYLNPYQPMVPDKEVHDYLNVSSVGENGVPQNLIKKETMSLFIDVQTIMTTKCNNHLLQYHFHHRQI
ncbi:unnamed protein product [Mytilus edulis]|uniref:Uncharacterized protein n=1 Tax=Mytilus edulis TaxID=6550 RepID=A0A8S3VAR2_MYTED|nr:unnamed protein product [Mytilus edulis]